MKTDEPRKLRVIYKSDHVHKYTAFQKAAASQASRKHSGGIAKEGMTETQLNMLSWDSPLCPYVSS